jgi:thiol:disulfide interchange protein
MRLSRTPALVIACLVADGGRSAPPAPAAVELKDVTYAELDKAIAAHKGKVVLVDVWATW